MPNRGVNLKNFAEAGRLSILARGKKNEEIRVFSDEYFYLQFTIITKLIYISKAPICPAYIRNKLKG
jgi:hypothetical protein